MKPQFKPEEIYLDLSKLSEEQQRKVIALLPEPINKDDYDIIYLHFYLIYDDEDCMWWVSTKYFLAEKTELTYSQFLDMMGESEEVLQVENNGWISVEKKLPSIEGEYLIHKKNDHIEVTYYDLKQWGYYYSGDEPPTHWMPLPEPPKF